MLEIKVTNSGVTIMGSGSGVDLLVDCSSAVNKLFSMIHSRNPQFAQEFRDAFTTVVNDPNGPLWCPTDVSNGMIITVPKGDHDRQ